MQTLEFLRTARWIASHFDSLSRKMLEDRELLRIFHVAPDEAARDVYIVAQNETTNDRCGTATICRGKNTVNVHDNQKTWE